MKTIKFFIILLSLFSKSQLWSQESVAQKEFLCSFVVGSGSGQAQYKEVDGGYAGLGSPFVDAYGTLFSIHTVDYSKLLLLNNNKVSEIRMPHGWPQMNFGLATNHFQSQQGVTIFGISLFSFDDQFHYTDFRDYIPASTLVNLAQAKVYTTPWGLFLEFPNRGLKPATLFALERLPTGRYRVREGVDISSWVTTQKGNFTIGSDGNIYRYGILWSALDPPEEPSGPLDYLARLASGHIIWTQYSARQDAKVFFISRPSGEIETTFRIDTMLGSYGVGPWGELYYIEAPPATDVVRGSLVWNSGEAKLYVIRSYLHHFGRLNDNGVRLRKEPNTTSEIIGTFPYKTGFRILEKGIKMDIIGGQKNVWYKVRLLDGTEGWFFGAFIQNLFDGPTGKAPPWPNVSDW